MSGPAPAVLYAAWLALLGFSWLRLFPAALPATAPGRAGWSFALGAFIWSYGLFLLNAAGVRPPALLLAAALTGLPWLGKRPALAWKTPALPKNAVLLAAALALALAAAVAAAQAAALPLHAWDGLVFYGHKAQILFQEGTFRAPAFYDRGIVHGFNDYPLLVPYVEASFYGVLGHTDDRAVNFVLLGFWLSLLAVVWDGLTDYLETDLTAAGTAILATLPVFAADAATNAVSGYVDVPFALFWTAAVVCLARWRRLGREGSLCAGAVFLAAAAFTKEEGLPLAAAWTALVLFFSRGRGRAWPSAVLLAALVAPWIFVRHGLPHNTDHPLALNAAVLSEAARRIPLVLFAVLRETFTVGRWGLLWPAAALVLLRKRPLSGPAVAVLCAAALQAAIYFAVYLLVPNELGGFLKASLDRVLIHGAGLAVLAAGWTLGSPRRTA